MCIEAGGMGGVMGGGTGGVQRILMFDHIKNDNTHVSNKYQTINLSIQQHEDQRIYRLRYLNQLEFC